jgi:hypothetical protein
MPSPTPLLTVDRRSPTRQAFDMSLELGRILGELAAWSFVVLAMSLILPFIWLVGFCRFLTRFDI